MFCPPNLRVVVLWSLPNLDPMRLVFFSFVVLFFDFVVVGANREIPKLLHVGLADVGRYSVKMCFFARSVSLRWVSVDRSFSFVVAGLPSFGRHSTELCGSLLRGAWPARAGECPPWVSA